MSIYDNLEFYTPDNPMGGDTNLGFHLRTPDSEEVQASLHYFPSSGSFTCYWSIGLAGERSRVSCSLYTGKREFVFDDLEDLKFQMTDQARETLRQNQDNILQTLQHPSWDIGRCAEFLHETLNEASTSLVEVFCGGDWYFRIDARELEDPRLIMSPDHSVEIVAGGPPETLGKDSCEEYLVETYVKGLRGLEDIFSAGL